MISAGAGYTTGENLSSLRNVTTQLGNIFIIDKFGFIYAEAAHLATTLAGAATAGFSFRSVSHGEYLLINFEKF
jgi:hypothetical protein